MGQAICSLDSHKESQLLGEQQVWQCQPAIRWACGACFHPRASGCRQPNNEQFSVILTDSAPVRGLTYPVMLLTGAGHQHLPDCKVVATCLAPALPRSRYASRARLHSERSHTSSICGATSSTGHHVQSIEQDPADNQAKYAVLDASTETWGSQKHDWHHNFEVCRCSRLQLLQRGCCLALLPFLSLAPPAQSALSKNEPMEGLKGKDYGKVRQRYPDYVLTESGNACCGMHHGYHVFLPGQSLMT